MYALGFPRAVKVQAHGTAQMPRAPITVARLHTLVQWRFSPSGHGSAMTRTAVTVSAKKKGKKEEDNLYTPTINLPETGFNQRAMATTKEPEIQQWWKEHGIYEALSQDGDGAPYTLHDGPPYANGDLHIGHALNKILKDFICRRKLLEGRKAKFVPGWDTHGLPIELKVLQTLSDEERRALTPVELRKKAREFALATVDNQREQFKRYGVWGDWEEPYVTLQPKYEAAQLDVFGKMVLNGHIYRGRKPVHWSPSSRTALAEAELEYPEGHKSKSIYVGMPVETIVDGARAELKDALSGAAFAIWTTTPWTIPANLAVAVNDELQYSVVEIPSDACEWLTNRKLVVAKDLIATMAGKLKIDASALKEIITVPGSELEGCAYRHPLFDRVSPLVVGGDYITTEAGTGLVHTAPGHGQEDYLVGQRYGLPLLSPVDDAGVFTEEAGPFAGLQVQEDGNAAVVQALKEAGVLLRVEDYKHKYPYDWRTKKPTIFRATDQWFASVDGFKQDALKAIQQVKWMPAVGENRITAMTEGRSDWCISRQRTWGVPIPVFYRKDTKEPLMTAETIAHIRDVVAEHGSDVWWTMDVAELLPESMRGEADNLIKGTDTMDVWFDSGSSWAGVVSSIEGLEYPADLYLEGSDQHRGWFQSSLLTSVASNGHAPYKAVLTHGFVLDEKGNKMSKSLGNTVDPRSVIDGGKNQKVEPPYGADVLRLWVCSVDYSNDVSIGGTILKQVFESYRRLRGSLRFLLGNVHDFDPSQHAIPYVQLPVMDRYMLHRLSGLLQRLQEAYDSFTFVSVYREINVFLSTDLSSLYLELGKDRLYVRGTGDFQRRSCQTVLHEVLVGLLTAMAPITPHTCEDAWQNLTFPAEKPASVFQAGVAAPRADWRLSDDDMFAVQAALTARDAALKALEAARDGKLIGAALEARVVLHASDDRTRAALQSLNAADNGVDNLNYVFVTSQVSVADDGAVEAGEYTATTQAESIGSITATVLRAEGKRCERCWNYSTELGSDPDHPHLCERCTPIVNQLGFKLPEPVANAA